MQDYLQLAISNRSAMKRLIHRKGIEGYSEDLARVAAMIRPGARLLDAWVADHFGDPFAIVLDGKIISAPRINGPITGGSGEITGNFTTQSANDLAVLLQLQDDPRKLEAIEKRAENARVPAWPWLPMGTAMRHLPLPLVRRLT